MGIRDRPTSVRAPWQQGDVERLIGSVRRECTDHLIVFSEEHLRQILAKYSTYYNEGGGEGGEEGGGEEGGEEGGGGERGGG